MIIWFNLVSDRMSVLELTGYADRYLVDRFATLDGVARVRIGGQQRYAMRVWLDRTALAAEETRTFFRGNGEPMVGIGVIKQAQANTLDVARAARALAERIGTTLPEGMELRQSYDSSVFIENAIAEVCKTLAIAIVLVTLVIYLFLGSARATLIPAVTVPVSMIGTCMVLNLLGFSINLLTLLAMVLAIGLVVDDAIVVLENVYRRMVTEKADAARLAGTALARSRGKVGPAAILAPWHHRATANARRLRKKR